MCFGGMILPKIKTNKYISEYTKKYGLQDKVNTRKDIEGNYHFWCVDEKGEIIDKTPNEMPDMDGEKIYISWTEKEQQYQKDYCNRSLLKYYGDNGDDLDGILDYIYYNDRYDYKKCYKNSLAIARHNPNYKLVCGSVGFKVDETENHNIISLDYGY
jgi:hypothetical protein